MKKIDQDKPLRARVMDAIVGAITDGHLKAGMAIPEQDLAESLGVSRTPVREAIRILEQQGVVVTQAKSGTFVNELTLEEIEDGYRLRAALEEFALGEALEVLSEDEWGELCCQLASLLEGMRQACSHSDWSHQTRLDLEWHTLQVEAAGNSVLSQAWRNLGLPLRFMVANRRYWPMSTEERLAGIEDHKELLNALLSRDKACISQAIRLHCLRRVRPRG